MYRQHKTLVTTALCPACVFTSEGSLLDTDWWGADGHTELYGNISQVVVIIVLVLFSKEKVKFPGSHTLVTTA